MSKKIVKSSFHKSKMFPIRHECCFELTYNLYLPKHRIPKLIAL